jgi:hypothetical protein
VMPRRLLLPAVALTLTTSIPLLLLTMAASPPPRMTRRMLRRSPIPATTLLPWRPKARIPTNTCSFTTRPMDRQLKSS